MSPRPLAALLLLASFAAAQEGRPPEEQAAPAAPAPAPAAEAETVLVRRLSDVVAVRVDGAARERVLYYFDPTAQLAVGGHLAQGSGGQSELLLPGGGLLVLYADGHVVVESLSPESQQLRLPLLTQLEVRAGGRLIDLQLPGGTRCRLLDTSARIRVDPGRMLIRNQGGSPVAVDGVMLLARDEDAAAAPRSVLLERGEEVAIPLHAGSEALDGQAVTAWGGLVVRHGRQLQLRLDGGRLRLAAPTSAEPAERGAIVGGVRTLAGSDALFIDNPLHRAAEPEAASAAGARVDPAADVEPDAAPDTPENRP